MKFLYIPESKIINDAKFTHFKCQIKLTIYLSRSLKLLHFISVNQ